MDEEYDDTITILKPTDSQNTVSTLNVYSIDYSTDEVSEKLNSSGMETYVLEFDSEEIESSNQSAQSDPSLKQTPRTLINRDMQCDATVNVNKATAISKCSIFAQEIFTQTSKTIVQLAENDGAERRVVNNDSLETQTSFISITENKTTEYRIEVTGNTVSANKVCQSATGYHIDTTVSLSCNDASSKYYATETVNPDYYSSNSSHNKISNDETESKENLLSEHNVYDNSSFEQISDSSPEETDLEDSLMIPTPRRSTSSNAENNELSETFHTPKSVDNEVAQLYNKLYECIELENHFSIEPEHKRFGHLSPLSEESSVQKDTTKDGTKADNTSLDKDDEDVLFTNNAGVKIKLFPNNQCFGESENIKLPPIHNSQSSSATPNLDFLFRDVSPSRSTRTGRLPCVYEEYIEKQDHWDYGSKDLASGESPHINGRKDTDQIPLESIQLPPIKVEAYTMNKVNKTNHLGPSIAKAVSALPLSKTPISINEKIKELKMSHRKNSSSKVSSPRYAESRSASPSLYCESRMTDAIEKGSEVLCVELLKRLRSQAWYEVTDTLDEIPRVLEKFWNVISEQRIADLIRSATANLESPRAQVARAACQALAVIIKNTNYTKKPDFYEAVTVLLTKTGSFSRPVRRAANVALDEIVCSVDLIHAITALCIHGTTHKSVLVRCAAARLLVVCSALGGGGRELLRARPPSAAAARAHTLRALSTLLDDKNTDTRKYAERLYIMLRPLSNFEAYYLTDVDVEIATRQMKKYDQLLLCVPPEGR